MEKFPNETLSIINTHDTALKHDMMDQSKLPRMTIVASSKHTPALQSLLSIATHDVTEIVCCSIEAAIRGKVVMVSGKTCSLMWKMFLQFHVLICF